MFVLLRVLGADPEAEVLKRGPGRNTITAEELETLLAAAPEHVTAEASDLVKSMYAAHTGNALNHKGNHFYL